VFVQYFLALKISCLPFSQKGASYLKIGCTLFENRVHPFQNTVFTPVMIFYIDLSIENVRLSSEMINGKKQNYRKCGKRIENQYFDVIFFFCLLKRDG
jgi:hypothetical protein